MRLLGPWLGSGVASAVLGACSAVRAGLVLDVAQLHSAGSARSWGAPLPLLRALGGRPSPCPCPLRRPGVHVVIALPRPESAPPSLPAGGAPTLVALPGTPSVSGSHCCRGGFRCGGRAWPFISAWCGERLPCRPPWPRLWAARAAASPGCAACRQRRLRRCRSGLGLGLLPASSPLTAVRPLSAGRAAERALRSRLLGPRW